LFKIIKKSTGTPSCVKPETAKKLIEKGWAQAVDVTKIDQFIKTLKSRESIGQVKKIAVVGIASDPKIFKSTPAAKSYKVIFEACAGERDIRAPEVILTSQSATSFVKLAQKIPANTCQTNAGVVSAIKPETIEIKLVNNGGISKKITELENKVSDLKEKLQAEKTQLQSRVQEGNKEKQGERISSIVELRTELNQAREELNRYLFALSTIPKVKVKDIEIPQTFKGTAIEGITINPLSVNKRLVEEGFDIVFEMCASSQTVKVPTAIISSDLESKTVKLSDRIIPNTCQLSGIKIKASSADSIQVSIGESAERSATVTELEKKISELADSLQAEHQALQKLTHFAPRPADFNDQAAKIADNIIDLRAQMNLAKAQLYNLLNQVYK
ncbi:MAG: hypothetical protein ACE5RJ_05540, partial [Nitrosopumilaceae archaeon]